MAVNHNSILFEFDSIVDIEISTINLVYSYDKESPLTLFKNEEPRLTNEQMKMMRKYGPSPLSSIIRDSNYTVEDAVSLFEDEKYLKWLIPYFEPTLMQRLIKVYGKSYNGRLISCTVRCDNNTQTEFVRENLPSANIINTSADKVDTHNYGRIIAGNWKKLMPYKFNSPHSLVVLDYIENFSNQESNLLKPELIIRFGDIHTINIANAHITTKEN